MNLSDRDRCILEAERAYFELKCRSGCLYRRGLNVRRGDPREHKNWKYFAAVVDLCDGLGTTVRDYLRCVLGRTGYDRDHKREVLPNMLLSEWAVDRWKKLRLELASEDTPELHRAGLLGALRVSRDFLRGRARSLFGDPNVPVGQLLRYRRQGSDQPEAIQWIFSGALSRPYLALSAAFWAWVGTIPCDLRDEYIEVDEVKRTLGELVADRELMERAKAVMGSDLIKGII
jgi:hypothetical protein